MQKKCEQYWPDKEEETLEVGGGIFVTLTNTVTFPHFTVRTMKVTQVI